MRIVPNIISIFRICLVPVFIVVYFADGQDTKFWPAVIYALASISDFFDGFIARRYKVSSKLGLILDPLGDKLMTFSVLVCITVDGIIPLWAVVVVGVKETLMAVGGLVLHKVANIGILPANMLGKTATVVFFIVCVTMMLFRCISDAAAIAMISFAIALTLVALAGYLKQFIAVMKTRDQGSGDDETRG